jgi:hypothetical protein
MWFLLFAGACGALVLLCWAVVKGRYALRLLAVFAALAIAYCVGYSLGAGWQGMKYEDRYVYPFSLYSTHLRRLVEEQQIHQLTNDVVEFDGHFNPRKDPEVLWKVVNQMLDRDLAQETNSVNARRNR